MQFTKNKKQQEKRNCFELSPGIFPTERLYHQQESLKENSLWQLVKLLVSKCMCMFPGGMKKAAADVLCDSALWVCFCIMVMHQITSPFSSGGMGWGRDPVSFSLFKIQNFHALGFHLACWLTVEGAWHKVAADWMWQVTGGCWGRLKRLLFVEVSIEGRAIDLIRAAVNLTLP